MPFLLYDGEPLVSIATAALASAGVELLDFTDDWPMVKARDAALVVHDPLCPATPADFLRTVLRECPADTVSVGVRPVTDTVKKSDAGVLGVTVDRSALVAVASPVVLPPDVVARLDDWPELDDLASLVEALGERFQTRFVEAPLTARRVSDASDLEVLGELA